MSEHLLLAPLLESFFRRRLAKQRNATPATLASYRDALRTKSEIHSRVRQSFQRPGNAFFHRGFANAGGLQRATLESVGIRKPLSEQRHELAIEHRAQLAGRAGISSARSPSAIWRP